MMLTVRADRTILWNPTCYLILVRVLQLISTFIIGEKKPKVVKKIKKEPTAVADDNDQVVKKVKRVTKAGTGKAPSDEGEATPAKKTKVVKATDSSDSKDSKVKKAKVAAIPSDFEGNDMFDLKELLGDDFLSEADGMGMGLLPNLDEDLAKLEANLSELGDFGFDFMDDDDDEALRSIESGKFNIEEFLKVGASDDELLSGLSDLQKKSTGEPGTYSAAGRPKKVVETNKKKKTVQTTLQQTLKVVEEDDDDDEGLEDDSVSDQVLEELALSLGLGADDLLDVRMKCILPFYS